MPSLCLLGLNLCAECLVGTFNQNMEKIMTFSFFCKELGVISTRSGSDNCNLAIRKLEEQKKNFDLGPDCRPPAKEIETSNFVEKVCATRCMFPP